MKNASTQVYIKIRKIAPLSGAGLYMSLHNTLENDTPSCLIRRHFIALVVIKGIYDEFYDSSSVEYRAL